MKRLAAYALLSSFAVAIFDAFFLSSRLPRLLLRGKDDQTLAAATVGITQLLASGSGPFSRKNEDIDNPGKELMLVTDFHGNGMSNQQNCLQIAANLAMQYNRTLLVPEVGYQGGKKSKHQSRSIAFHDLYDEKKSAERISYGIYYAKSDKAPHCSTIITIGGLGPHDPHPIEHCIQFKCSNGVVHRETPIHVFPHANRVHFPYNRFFGYLASEVIRAMRERTASQKIARADIDSDVEEHPPSFRLVTLHVRRGDREAWPLVNCSEVASLYPNRVQVYKKRAILCSSATDSVRLSWARFFHHLAGELPCDDDHSSFLMCARRFDAIFVATNDPRWVRDEVGPLTPKLPPVFVSGDFPFVKEKLLSRIKNRDGSQGEIGVDEETVEMLAVDELVMAHSAIHVPSFPSSITEQTLRLRMEEKISNRDQSLYDMYDEYKDLQRGRRFQRQEKRVQKAMMPPGRISNQIGDLNHNESFLEIMLDENEAEKEALFILPEPKFNTTCIPTALASYPGSGSTIVRLLIEMATGVWTGSIYRDLSLYNGSPHAFQGEGSIRNVVAVKTHITNKLLLPKRRNRRRGVSPIEAGRTVLIVRNPEGAIPSKFNFVYWKKSDQKHQIQAPKDAWEDWRNTHFAEELKLWSDHLQYWADNFALPGQLFVVKFEDLVSNETGPASLLNLTSFLGFPSTNATLTWKAVMQVLSKGIHRPKSYKPELTPTLQTKTVETLNRIIRKYRRSSPMIASILNSYVQTKL